LPGKEELLLVELIGHFFLERLVKELTEDDDEGEDDQKGQNDPRGHEELLLF
jgi:hypothetical protein